VLLGDARLEALAVALEQLGQENEAAVVRDRLAQLDD
jgi:hypothetical protein